MSKCGCFKKVHSNTSLNNGLFVVPNSIKIQSKIVSKSTKIGPRSTQNRSQICSGTKLEPSKAAPGPSWSQVDAQIGSGTDFFHFLLIPIAYAIGLLGWCRVSGCRRLWLVALAKKARKTRGKWSLERSKARKTQAKWSLERQKARKT